MEIWLLISSFFHEFWELSKEMSPYLLLGFLVAGILNGYFSSEKITKYLGKRNLASVVNASLLGIPLPLCSCGVIPVGVSFYKNGASKGSAVSFLISTPQTGVDSILVTYSLLGLPFAIVRPVIALITGIFGGWFTGTADKDVQATESTITGERSNVHLKPVERFKGMLRYAFVDFLNDISKWLVIGLLIAALIAVFVPDSFFSDYVGNEYFSMLLVLLASVPMYVCATGSVPIAAVLIAKGMSPGAAIVFLMAGPATNVATMMVIGKSMGRRTLIRYLLSIIGGALFFGILINELPFLRQYFIATIDHDGMHSHLIPEWIKLTSVIVLGVLMINGYFSKHKKVNMHNSKLKTEEQQVVVGVNGMTCGHCKNSVETNVGKLEGINEVTADLAHHVVAIKGKDVDIAKVKSVINELGYEFVEEK